MAVPADGILLIDKNEGETSFDVVKGVRRLLKGRKVGHAGTLDPFATGLLIVLSGEGTKLSSYLMSGEKRYLATLCLGVETDTQDPTGRIVRRTPVPEYASDFIQENVLLFQGEIVQVPPIYSAVHSAGRRSYELARKGFRPALDQRKVVIHHLEIVSIALPDVVVDIRCSGGTYIRSIASDIGRQLKTGAHLKALRRLSSGPFEVKDALSSKQIRDDSSADLLRGRIIPLGEALPDMKEVQVDHRMARKIRNGFQPKWRDVAGPVSSPPSHGYIKVVKGREMVAIMGANSKSDHDVGLLKTLRVFNERPTERNELNITKEG